LAKARIEGPALDFYTYMLRCSDGKYYVGHTDDLDSRVAQHQSGAIPGYTQKRLPVELVWAELFPDRDIAFAAERQIKGWGRAKKEALIQGKWEDLKRLAKKSFDTPLRLRSAATQDERNSVTASTGHCRTKVTCATSMPPPLKPPSQYIR
jgi:tRNA/rRNA methyltransferase